MRRSGILLLLTLLVGGCSDTRHADLRTYIDETLARPAGEIEPVPPLRPYKTYKYSAMTLRSPFDPPRDAAAMDGNFGRTTVAPDETRPREFLEGIAFASLSMVGILERNGAIWALIDDGRGGIHRVSVGNYLGKNHGRIVSLSRTQIDIIEIVPDGKNGWIERPRTLTLKETQS